MSAEVNEKRGRRRRGTDTKTTVVETDQEVIEEGLEAAEQIQRGITAPKGRPTVGRRNRVQAEEPEGNVVTRTLSGPQGYLAGVQEELRKVSWPTREEVVRLARIVIGVLIISAVVLGAISLAFTTLFAQGLQNPVVFLVFFVLAGIAVYVGNRWYRNINSDSHTNYPTRL